MILTGNTIDAAEAYRIGLVNKVTKAEDLMDTAHQYAQRICDQGPLGVRAAKEAMIRGMSMSMDDGLRLEQSMFDGLRYTEDFTEGPKAFAEKRRPEFHGR